MKFLLPILLLVCGCSLTPKTPKFFHNSKTGVTTQSGEIAKPANVSTIDTKTEIPFPPGSVITIQTPATLASSTDQKAQPAVIVNDHREAISTPASFAPPSASELAKASSVKWFGIAGLLFIVAAAPLGYFGHVKAALVCVGAGIIVPLIGQFLSHDWALYAAIGLACVAGSLYAAWHFVKHRINEPNTK